MERTRFDMRDTISFFLRIVNMPVYYSHSQKNRNLVALLFPSKIEHVITGNRTVPQDVPHGRLT